MAKSIVAQVKELSLMTVGELHERYLALFGEESRSRNKPQLIKRIAYRMQEQDEGGLSERARQRAEELADEAHIHVIVPAPEPVEAPAQPARDSRLPAPGTVLVREFGGKRHEVTVRARDFDYEGKSYRSLSAVARAITGTAWNGFKFFKSALEAGK